MELKFSENQDATQEKININFYNDLEKAKSALTEDIVFNHFRASAKIKLQDVCRKLSAKGESLEKIKNFINVNMDNLLAKSGRVKKADIVAAINGKIGPLTLQAAQAQNFDLLMSIQDVSKTTDTSASVDVLKANWARTLEIENQLTET